MDTRFLSHRDSSSVSQQSKRELGSQRLGEQFDKVCAAVRAGNSVLVLGEAGTGKGDFAQALHKEMLDEFQCAIATYKGSLKKFFVAIAFQLGCPTENDQGKALTVDALKEEILENSSEDTLLILPEAKRLTTSIRYWLEDMISSGVCVVCFAVANPGKDIFLEMLEIELELPSDRSIQ
ncbi:MAG: sigma 54-interacting transcriptional regulator [Xenococcaceae cyanobacterium MO_234.B1]|nr:sigma 54-interacting transcriptional regulator [Xenococcaceae cyanobacterium MO_234.B1]